MNKWMKKMIIGVSIILLVGIGFGSISIMNLLNGLDEVQTIEIQAISPNNLEDGDYEGTYDYGRWANNVKVTIRDSKIITIEVVKDVVYKKDEVQKELIKRVINAQSTSVDTVSGATVTSKAYLKAIENALKEGQKK